MARRTAIIIGPVTQVMFFLAAARLRPALELYYILLYGLIAIQILFHWMATGEKAIDFEQLDLKRSSRWWLPRPVLQILGGIAFGLVPGTLLLLGGTMRSVTDFANEAATQAFFVGLVETLYLIATVRTVMYGPWVWVLGVFPFAHETVRTALFAADMQGFALGYAYTAGFGLYFWFLFAAADPKSPAYMGEKWGEWFGALNSWTAHVVVNLLVLAILFAVYGFTFFAV